MPHHRGGHVGAMINGKFTLEGHPLGERAGESVLTPEQIRSLSPPEDHSFPRHSGSAIGVAWFAAFTIVSIFLWVLR